MRLADPAVQSFEIADELDDIEDMEEDEMDDDEGDDDESSRPNKKARAS
jgi:hypothetical protein